MMGHIPTLQKASLISNISDKRREIRATVCNQITDAQAFN